MKAFIQHESRGRLRVRMHQYRMSLEQADLLEAYLLNQPGVKSAAVHERTCCATVCYTGSRAELLHAIGRFDYRSPAVTALAPQHSGRALNREYQEKLVTMVAVKAACTLFLPTPLQIVRTVCMAAPFLCRGLRRLLRGQLRVPAVRAIGMIVIIEVGIIAAQDAATVVAADIVLVKTALAERVMIVLNGAFLIDAVATVVTDYGQMVGTVLTEPVTLYLKHLAD